MLEGIPQEVSVRGQMVERYQLTGPMELRDKVFDVLTEGDFRITRSGPKPIPGEIRVDPKIFFIVAEKERTV